MMMILVVNGDGDPGGLMMLMLMMTKLSVCSAKQFAKDTDVL